MKSNRIDPVPSSCRKACERLSKRLDALANREGAFDNTELILAMRRAYFADVDACEQSGEVKLPE